MSKRTNIGTNLTRNDFGVNDSQETRRLVKKPGSKSGISSTEALPNKGYNVKAANKYVLSLSSNVPAEMRTPNIRNGGAASRLSLSTPRRKVSRPLYCSPCASMIRGVINTPSNCDSSPVPLSATESSPAGAFSLNVTYVISRSRKASPANPTGQKLDKDYRVLGNKTTENNKLRRLKDVSVVKSSFTRRRSKSATEGNVRSAGTNESNVFVKKQSKPRPPIFSLPKRQEIKIPVVTESPKSVQFSQRKFGKVESFVEVKRRHSPMVNREIPSSLITVPRKQIRSRVSAIAAAPSVAVDGGVYNRYGFKLRKYDAIMIVSRKLPIHTRDKRIENRTLLKAIHSNRRFALMMNYRNNIK